MSVTDFFQGVFSFPINADMVRSACFLRGVDAENDVLAGVDEKTRDLVLADILVMLSRASMSFVQSTTGGEFTMNIQGGLIPLADRNAMRCEANKLYAKHGENDSIRVQSSINIY